MRAGEDPLPLQEPAAEARHQAPTHSPRLGANGTHRLGRELTTNNCIRLGGIRQETDGLQEDFARRFGMSLGNFIIAVTERFGRN